MFLIMEFKGTKGKWEFSENGGVHVTTNSGMICDLITSSQKDKADALLISKAPEMLEALKMFVEAVYTEEIIIKENYDNDGHENCGGRLYQKFKQLIKEVTEL